MPKSTYELINEFRKEMNERFDEMRECYVTKDRFNPVERLVYGMTGVVLVAVIGSLIALVLNKTGVSATW